MNLDDSRTVKLVIDLGKSRKELESDVAKLGTPVSDTMRVSETMTAHLVSDDFTVTPISPETQDLVGNGSTTWLWEIKPKTWGKLGLKLTLDAELGPANAGRHRYLQTYDKDIEVHVWPVHWRRIQDFLVAYWQWVFGSLLVPILLWVIRKFRRDPLDLTGA